MAAASDSQSETAAIRLDGWRRCFALRGVARLIAVICGGFGGVRGDNDAICVNLSRDGRMVAALLFWLCAGEAGDVCGRSCAN